MKRLYTLRSLLRDTDLKASYTPAASADVDEEGNEIKVASNCKGDVDSLWALYRGKAEKLLKTSSAKKGGKPAAEGEPSVAEGASRGVGGCNIDEVARGFRQMHFEAAAKVSSYLGI
jgi:hypothetical protein